MAFTSAITSSEPSEEAPGGHVDAPELRYFVMALFFIFGGITSLNDVIIPKLKELFTLSYTEAMLVQFCFFTAYAVIGIPGAMLVRGIGYMRGAAAGLAIMIVGCLAFIPASQTATYWLFLAAYFVLAAGVVIVQVVANPLISLLGKPETTSSRLTFAQAFNSLGTTIFPIAGAVLILGSLAAVSAHDLSGAALDAYRRAESQAIVHGYLAIAGALALVIAAVWAFRNRLPPQQHGDHAGFAGFDLLKRPRFRFGTLCIFLYVGAEVSIGSLIVSYLMQDHVMALPEQSAGKLIGLYWGGAMLGRFIGSAVLRVLDPGRVLAVNAFTAIALLALSVASTGTVSGYALLAVGLMNSIMFPTIFSLACEKLGARAADGSGIINVAICGGALVPLATGALADLTGGNLGMALVLPALCYAVIAGFGVSARRPAPVPETEALRSGAFPPI
ncbi:sugar MFS transporter [Novosphingobium aerophilum]|uniref:sugar MFS transporter n=1 Tax=Novosphingobium TaxID=165696 RepID=UPI0012CF6091|nr:MULTISPECIES: sugar MFS transporter [unclassified Novosphingobium]MPS70195.1 sugar MFS transporter [Novosphingobium sp.]WRT94830.1 sugar MFS transporter [Novosphingobium sp. RL4]